MARIRCVPTHKIWSDDNNEFKIYAIDVKESNTDLEFNKYGNITVSGVCSDFDLGEEYTLTVTKSQNSKYKGSYELRSINRLLPTSREDKFTFLSFVISDRQSNELLDTYPDVIRMIMDNDTDLIDVNKLHGIGEKTLEKIVDKVNDNFVLIDLVSKFSHYGLTHKEIKKLHAKYKNTEKLILKMENEPYPVLCSLDGIGFKKADQRILKGNPEMKKSNQRLIEAIKYIIFNGSGDSAITLKLMYKQLSDLDNSLRIMLKDIVDSKDYDALKGIKIYGDVVTTDRLFEKAKYVFVKLLKLSKGKNISKFDINLEDYKIRDGINVTDEQLNVVEMMNESNFGMLIGSAGCVDSETEYFNGEKWVKICEYKEGDKVLQYTEDRTAELVEPTKYHKYKLAKNETMTFINNKTNQINQVLSDEHNFVYITSKGNINKKPFHRVKQMHYKSTNGFGGRIIGDFKYNGEGINYSDEMIKLKLAIYADGSIYKVDSNNGHDRIRFHLKKNRKKKELVKLFKENNLEYRESDSKAEGYTDYYIDLPEDSKQFGSNWYNCSQRQLQLIADNILQWDGSVGKKKGRKSWSTTIKSDADFVQFVFSSVGYPSNISINDRVGQEYLTAGKIYTRQSIEYEVSISKRKNRRRSLSIENHWYDMMSDFIPKDGYKYCFTVPSSMLVLRRDNNIFVTGNSGKTTTTNTFLNMLDDNNATYELCAPTGAASKVLSNHTGRPAQTIHRLLKYNPKRGWGVNEDKPLTCDFLLVDEVSMVSLNIMYRLLKGVNINTTKIIFVADSAQIPSIGLGNILHDLVQSNLFPVNRLTKVFRYGGGGLDMIATKVRKGESWFESDVKTPMIFGDDQDFVFVPYNKSKGLKTLLKTYKSLLKKHDVSDIMVTMIYNKGSYGTVRINKLLQEIYNPPKDGLNEISYGGITYREGDKVINIENDYKARILFGKPDENMTDNDIKFNTVDKDKAIYNGDIGVIEKIMDDHVIVYVDDKYYIYTKTKLKKLNLSYAISTHKSQGSESDYVIMFYPSNHAYMMNRNLFYVAMTRAKKKTITIGSPKTIKKAMYKAEQFNRMTNLNNIINAYKSKTSNE